MKYYKNPIMFLVDEGGEIITDGSETSGPGDILDMYSFSEDIDESDITMILATLDSFDLAEMDTDEDFFISLEEFTTWYNANEPW